MLQETELELQSLNEFLKSGDCTPLAGLADWLTEHTDRTHFAGLCAGVATAASGVQKAIHWFYTHAPFDQWIENGPKETLGQYRLRNAAAWTFAEKWGDEDNKDTIRFLWDHDREEGLWSRPSSVDHEEPLWMCQMQRRPAFPVRPNGPSLLGDWADTDSMGMIDLGEDVVTNRHPVDPLYAITDGSGQLIPKIRLVHAELLAKHASASTVPTWAWKEPAEKPEYPSPDYEYAVCRMSGYGPTLVFPEVPAGTGQARLCLAAHLEMGKPFYMGVVYEDFIRSSKPLDWHNAAKTIAVLEQAGWQFSVRKRAFSGHAGRLAMRHQARNK